MTEPVTPHGGKLLDVFERAYWGSSPEDHRISEYRIEAGIAAVRLLIEAGERTRIADALIEKAAFYPEAQFPTDATSRDGISGAAMRHAYKEAARLIHAMNIPPDEEDLS